MNIIRTLNVKKAMVCLVSILLAQAVGVLSAALSGGQTEIYKSLKLPPLSPPGAVFPIMWFILYTLMGIAAYLVYKSRSLDREDALKFYFMQLAVNFLWSIFFFRFRLFGFSAIWLMLLIVLVAMTAMHFYRIDKTAGFLMIPYIAWLIFALYLNLGIFFLN